MIVKSAEKHVDDLLDDYVTLRLNVLEEKVFIFIYCICMFIIVLTSIIEIYLYMYYTSCLNEL